MSKRVEKESRAYGIVTLAGLALVLMIAGPLAKGVQPGGHLSIEEVFVDFDLETVTIVGKDFDFGGLPQVTLGEEGNIGDITSLCAPDFAFMPQMITCDFSGIGLPDNGDYLLTVAAGHGQSQSDEYDLTIATPATAGSVLQTRVFSDYTRRVTNRYGSYYYGGSEFSNSITPTKSDSIILISINYFGEATNHNATARLQYSLNSGPWLDFDLTGTGLQQGTMKLGSYPDGDYNSTPHNYSTQVAKAFGTTETISFRLYHFNPGSFYHNSSANPNAESGPSTLVLEELNAQNSSYFKR